MPISKLGDLLKQKKIIKTAPTGRPINPRWEQAKEFCEYLGFRDDKAMVVFVLMLCRRYGDGKVFAMKSFLKDADYRRAEVQGLMVWQLKGGFSQKKK